MRILVLPSTFPRWAGDRGPPFVCELCKRRAGAHEVFVLAPHCRGAADQEMMGERLAVRRFRYAPELLELLAYEGGILENLKRARWRYLLVPLFFFAEWRAALRAIRRERPDVIHAHWIVPQGVVAVIARLAAFGAKRPAIVCTSHGTDLFALRGALASQFKACVVRRAAVLTVVSAAMKTQALRLGALAENVRVMPMGVDARQRFYPDGGARRSANELLFVGRLVRQKGIVHLLEAFATVRESNSDAPLVVVGAGPLERELRRHAQELAIDAAVTFAGAVANENLARYYRRAAALVVPSIVTDRKSVV